jgi:Asp-tRNA(Asn)/Glu-tRNA(Gln) amidotransferase A subunit family amidase
VPLEGCLPLSPSFDVAGPMARSVADCALAYSVLGATPVPESSIEGLSVGVLERPPGMSPFDPGGSPDGVDAPDISGALTQLESLGARLEPATIEQPQAELLPVFLSEAASAHRTTFPSRREDYGPDTQMKFATANAVAAEDVQRARHELVRWRAASRDAPGPDLYVSPTLAGPIPPIDVWEPDVRVAMIGHTRPFSFLGWPAIAIGELQFAARSSSTVLAAALAWEDAFGSAWVAS